MDQQVMAYYKNRRLRWHIKVMVHFFYIALNNAQINYRDLTKQTMVECPFLDFLILEVIADAACDAPVAQRPDAGTHTPMMHGTEPKRAPGEPPKKQQRRRCKECGEKCTTWYKECKAYIYLHINTVTTGKTCWSDHHQGHDYPDGK